MHTQHGVASLVHEPFNNKDNKTRLAKTSITIVPHHAAVYYYNRSSREEMVCNDKRERNGTRAFLNVDDTYGTGVEKR